MRNKNSNKVKKIKINNKVVVIKMMINLVNKINNKNKKNNPKNKKNKSQNLKYN
jgi:hypothetical protein